eukprot:TRINITY_DN30576_c0_g1_i5.p1 TRINITY_DN30576_c0_g1~~TRINITY_DN30576_c0_g1_i5.p1  ORF type:complete len:639 (+),score=101.64 TRINITY_DN30576_c0_g1_i5:25-1941(+)
MKWYEIVSIQCFLVIQVTLQQSPIVRDACGKRGRVVCPLKDSLNLRVTGGEHTCAERVPWNVLVENRESVKDGEIEPYCGGVLLTERHVLSAAHCFWSNQNQFGICPRQFGNSNSTTCSQRGCPKACTRVAPRDIRLHLGLTSRLEPDSGIMRDISRIDLHPGWDRSTRLNDILEGHDLAVLTMTRSVNIFGPKVKPACLPPNNFYPSVGSKAEVSGFGADIDERGKTYPKLVKKADLTINSGEMCANIWQASGNQICALGNSVVDTDPSEVRIADSCNGDSGGGLTQQNRDGREMVIGIISFGEPECGRKGGKPGVYSNVGDLDNLNWIKSIINDEDGGTGSTGTKACFASNNKRCEFPFRFQGETFASCTTKHDPEGLAWCSTLVDEQRNHVVGEGEWGHCPSTCLVDITARPTKPSGGGDSNNGDGSGGAEWSEWSSCSKSCGSGTRVRTNNFCPRNVNNNCVTREEESCFLRSCPRPTRPPTTFRPTQSNQVQNQNNPVNNRPTPAPFQPPPTQPPQTQQQEQDNSRENEEDGEFKLNFKACQFSGTCNTRNSQQSSSSTSNFENSDRSQGGGGIVITSSSSGGGRPNFFQDPRGGSGRRPPFRGGNGGRRPIFRGGGGRPPFRGGRDVIIFRV